MALQVYKFRWVIDYDMIHNGTTYLLDKYGRRYYFHYAKDDELWYLDALAGIEDGSPLLTGKKRSEIVETLNGLDFISIKTF